jgi:hypothetical protein
VAVGIPNPDTSTRRLHAIAGALEALTPQMLCAPQMSGDALTIPFRRRSVMDRRPRLLTTAVARQVSAELVSQTSEELSFCCAGYFGGKSSAIVIAAGDVHVATEGLDPVFQPDESGTAAGRGAAHAVICHR